MSSRSQYDQFNLGIDLMSRGLDCKNGKPGC